MGELIIGGSSVRTACDSFEQSVDGAQTGRCGICMEEVIDRGVLDCCNHWFCFKCIDNWAVITNLCPLCKAQFEIISCVPVHDTISRNNEWNSSVLEGTERDEGWCIYGKNRALSFPSYYIDEDAIVCLDGDACRIRSGDIMEESSSLDTSVACDSCDIWYHAVCVGFDSECTTEGTWLCPRCKMSSVVEDLKSTFSQFSVEKDQCSKSSDDMLLNSKMSVHVADSGETAVVVSMFEGENCGPVIDEKPAEVAPVEEEQNSKKISVPLCTNAKTRKLEKPGGCEPISQLSESGDSKDCTIFPSIKDSTSTSTLVEDCSQKLFMVVPDEEIKHASVVFPMSDGQNPGPAIQANLGVVPVNDKPNSNKVAEPLCTKINTVSIEVQKDQPVLQYAENIVSIDACKGGIMLPSISDLTPVLVEDCTQTAVVTDEEINIADAPPANGMSDSATEVRDGEMPISLLENSNFSGLITDIQNVVESSRSKGIKEGREMTIGFGNSRGSNSLENSHAQKGAKLSSDSYPADLPVCQDQINYSTLTADKDMVKRVHTNGSILDREPIKNGGKRNQHPQCRDALATGDSMPFDQRVGKIVKQKEISTKRAQSSGQNGQIHLPSPKTQGNEDTAVLKESLGLKKKLKAEKFEDHSKSEAILPEIMNIVKGQEFPAPAKELANCSSRKTGNDNNQVNGVRVKKIMPRRMDENETSCLVQEMTKELRAAVGHGNMEDLGKIDAFDERLLEAFKAAMKKTFKNDYRSNLCDVRVNKQPLKRGKIRENLTKKIYSTGNGKRRRAWDRDCEIEFWKAKCNKEKRLKLVETPDSIKGLLKKALDSCTRSSETENRSKPNEVDPLFSRLYLADNNLFPRRDDIKPLSALSNSGILQAGSCDMGTKVEERSSNFEILRSKVDNVSGSHPTKRCLDVEESRSSQKSGGIQGTVSEQKSGNSGGMKHDKVVESKYGNSKDVKLDKRKWALEVLARKTAADQKKDEPGIGEKGSFPLLIQLPIDMRPILPHGHRSKVPTSVRQIQLNRLVEYYLKNANMETIRRTAESEFAVADAVNKEKKIYERSNSKSVYINLCAQSLSQQGSSHNVIENGKACHELGTELSDNVSAALKAAGLISDSPPGSPYHVSEDSDVEASTIIENKDDSTGCTENVLELDCNPALDIFGDFEYDLEDVEDAGVSSISNSIPAIQSEDGASKVKVVLSRAQQNNQLANEQVGGHKKEMCVEQPDTGEPKSLLSRGVFMSEANRVVVLGLEDMHAGRGIEGSEILDTSIPKNNSHISLPDAGEDIKAHVPKVDLCQDTQCEHGLSFKGGSAINPSGSQDRSSLGKHSLNKIKRHASSVLGPVEESVSDSQLDNDQVGDGLGSVILYPRVIRENKKRGGSDCENDAALSKTKRYKDNSEMKQKRSVPVVPSGDGSMKTCEMDRYKQRSDVSHSVAKKVEVYVKEHIRPLCKSGVVTVEQYRWAVGKTVDKVMRYHCNSKNADFLIPEGNKVKTLAEQYLQAFKPKETC